MIITIRPAPHSKQCAIGTQGCREGRNNPAACDTCGTCCERKHCMQLGLALADMLRDRGHGVYIIGDEYALGYPDTKANANAYAAMRCVTAINPGLHIAIHTNSAAKSVRGVRIGYPEGSTERVMRSRVLAEMVAARNRDVYPIPQKVITCTYPFLELNRPACPALYIEAAFANSNVEDARWIHGNIQAIAQSYAQGIQDWTEQEEAANNMATLYRAEINTSGDAGLFLWTSSLKTERVIQVRKGAIVDVLSAPDSKGFCLCSYAGKQGWADSKYLNRVIDAGGGDHMLDRLYAARTALDAAIKEAGGK